MPSEGKQKAANATPGQLFRRGCVSDGAGNKEFTIPLDHDGVPLNSLSVEVEDNIVSLMDFEPDLMSFSMVSKYCRFLACRYLFRALALRRSLEMLIFNFNSLSDKDGIVVDFRHWVRTIELEFRPDTPGTVNLGALMLFPDGPAPIQTIQTLFPISIARGLLNMRNLRRIDLDLSDCSIGTIYAFRDHMELQKPLPHLNYVSLKGRPDAVMALLSLCERNKLHTLRLLTDYLLAHQAILYREISRCQNNIRQLRIASSLNRIFHEQVRVFDLTELALVARNFPNVEQLFVHNDAVRMDQDVLISDAVDWRNHLTGALDEFAKMKKLRQLGITMYNSNILAIIDEAPTKIWYEPKGTRPLREKWYKEQSPSFFHALPGLDDLWIVHGSTYDFYHCRMEHGELDFTRLSTSDYKKPFYESFPLSMMTP